MKTEQLPQFDLEKVKRNIDLFIQREGVPKLFPKPPKKQRVIVGEGKYFDYIDTLGTRKTSEIYHYEEKEFTPPNRDEVFAARLYEGWVAEGSHFFGVTDMSSWRKFKYKLLDYDYEEKARFFPNAFKHLLEIEETVNAEENANNQPSLRNSSVIAGYWLLQKRGINEIMSNFLRPINSEMQRIPLQLRLISYRYDFNSGNIILEQQED